MSSIIKWAIKEIEKSTKELEERLNKRINYDYENNIIYITPTRMKIRN